MSAGQPGGQVASSEPAHVDSGDAAESSLFSLAWVRAELGRRWPFLLEGPVERTVGQETKPGSRMEEEIILRLRWS